MKYINCYLLFVFLPALFSCNEKPKEKIQAPAVVIADTAPVNTPVVGSVPQRATHDSIACEFVAYNDNGDYTQLTCKKGKDLHSFINDKNEDRSLLRGDTILVAWKYDTIYIAGDGERPEQARWVLTVKKLKEGNVSLFRKKYGKPLSYWSAQDYSDTYKTKLSLLVEYYLSRTKNKLLQYAIEQKENLEFSIEEQVRKNRTYEVLGIATVEEHRHNTVQWLYYDRETGVLYEYDLPNDRLVLFDREY